MGRAWQSVGNGRGRLIGTFALASAITLSGGCAGGGRRPIKASSGDYAGPPVSIDSLADQHVVVLQAPSAGWAFTMDRTEPAVRSTEVFLTATRPNPAFMHAQQVVPLRAGTGVEARKPIDVYVQVLDFAGKVGEDGYRLVTRTGR